jgi:hypothetical protein
MFRKNDPSETSQESPERHLWPLVITNRNTSTEQMVALGKIFHVSSNNVSSLPIKSGNFSGMRPETFKVWQNELLSNYPDKLQA